MKIRAQMEAQERLILSALNTSFLPILPASK
jgi:hypothetical protein